MNGLTTVILAAGEGKRMRSRTPKVLHPLCGRPLIAYALRLARTLGDRVILVVGPNADAVRAVAGDDVTVVEPRERRHPRPPRGRRPCGRPAGAERPGPRRAPGSRRLPGHRPPAGAGGGHAAVAA